MKPLPRLVAERIRSVWMGLSMSLVLITPCAIGAILLYKSWPLINSSNSVFLVLHNNWTPMEGEFGLAPFVFSSIMIALIALLIMAPLSLASAVYITQFAPRFLATAMRSSIDILAGIPSVIYGLWGIMVIVPFVAGWADTLGMDNLSGYSILAAGLVAAFSVMPFTLNMLIEQFESISPELLESALSLGASRWQAVKDVMMKKIRSGILASFTLGVSKAFGETIAVLMVAGCVAQMPNGPFDPGYPLPALLANNYGEMMSIPQYESALMLSALFLLGIVVFFNFLARKVIGLYLSEN